MSSPLRSVLARRPIHEGWEVVAAAGPIPAALAGAVLPAKVPGQVHLDLMAAGAIPDPYVDDNESALAWIGLTDWTYRTVFTLDEVGGAPRHDLVFEGVDTVAEIRLNGRLLAETANQHRTYRFDVTHTLRDGENELVVAFRSPVKYADRQSTLLGARPRPYPTPYEAIRKSAASFGWDWGISTASSGLWRSVTLESWAVARLARTLVRAVPHHDGGGQVTASVLIDRAAAGELEVELEVAGTCVTVVVPDGEDAVSLSVALDDVDRWWPVGYGEQPLYVVVVRLRADGDVVDDTVRRVGFRTVRWHTEPDAEGTPFQLVVNDLPVYVKGANWIPDDALVARIDRDRYRARLEQARKAHVNLIRVWGGGIYESDDFFDVCDELGLLTWQDFLFACAAYPEEEPLRSEVIAEARDNVSRLVHHASLVLLNGNNENLWGYEDWGWQLALDGRTWGAAYYDRILPEIVAELAPHVPYTPGSPFSPHGQHPNDENHGSTHLWEQWNRRDWLTYRDHRPRFVAEFGWQGPPTWTTMTRAITDDPLTPESPGMIVHQKAAEGNTKLTAGLVRHYRVPDEIGAWHWAMQLNQAVAVRTALEWFRSLAPRNAGAVVWQLNDCWPVTSWAAIDGDGREKPLLFALKNAFAPRTVAIQPAADAVSVVLSNDSAEDWSGALVIRRRRFDGAICAEHAVEVAVPARGTLAVAPPDALSNPTEARSEVLEAELGGIRGLWYFVEGRHSALPTPQWRIDLHRDGGDWMVAVTAATFLRDLTLLPDLLGGNATVDSGLISLFPRQSHVFRVSGLDELTPADIESALRTANELVIR